MIELSLNTVEKYFGANLILSNISFEIHQGERVGLVGRNGSGKSTILKMISGLESLDKGNIAIRKGATIGYLEQIPSYKDEYKVSEVLNIAFKDLIEIEEDMVSLENKMRILEGEELNKVLKQYSNMQEKHELLGGYEKEEKFNRICKGLEFTSEFLDKQFSLLSGGEKTTVMLGKILLENPDVLLLDEPTNHLDMDALDWLENYLKEYKGTVLIVSHDRYFLDSVVSKVVELEDLESKTYIGNYSSFINQKEENIRLELETYKEQQKKVESMQDSIKTLRDWANRAGNEKFYRRAESMQKRLDKMEKADRPNTQKQNMKLNFISSGRSGQEVVKIEGACKSFDDKVLFNNANLLVTYGESVFKKVESLSGGEKTRLKLSKLLYEDVNLLILDEPTNHLDIDSIETLEEALMDFKGTIFFISHDRYFINKICHRIVALENKKLTSYMGNYDYYRIKRDELVEKTNTSKIEIEEEKHERKKVKPINHTKKKEIALKSLEKKIYKLEQELAELNTKVNSLGSDYIELSKCTSQKEKIENELEELMEEWIEVSS